MANCTSLCLFCQLEHVLLAHQRLAAGQHIQVHAQLLALRDDLVHILKAEVVLVAVLACPQPSAVMSAARGWVNKGAGNAGAWYLTRFSRIILVPRKKASYPRFSAVVRATWGSVWSSTQLMSFVHLLLGSVSTFLAFS